MLPEEKNNAEENILVTGATGLVGEELVRQLLSSGKKVTALYHLTPLQEYNSPLLTSIQCDILDTNMLEEAMQGITHVYHCAAIVSFNKKLKKEIYKVNIEGTTNVVNACIDAKVKKLVHVSSVAALNRSHDGENITEEMTWAEEPGHGDYGRSKFLAEMEVWRGIGEGLQAVIVNPSTILGGTDWDKSSVKIFKTAYQEFPFYTEGVAGFVDVRDVAMAMILLMNSEISNERFILNAENVSYKNLFTGIAKGFNKKPPHKKVTSFMAEVVWRMEALKSFITGKEHLLNKETARKALSKSYYDNSKIKNSLPGFSFRPIEETINDTCTSLQQLGGGL